MFYCDLYQPIKLHIFLCGSSVMGKTSKILYIYIYADYIHTIHYNNDTQGMPAYGATSVVLFLHLLFDQVEIDRRMLDFCVGLDTEFSEIVEGSHLYYPKTQFTQASSQPEGLKLNVTRCFNYKYRQSSVKSKRLSFSIQ